MTTSNAAPMVSVPVEPLNDLQRAVLAWLCVSPDGEQVDATARTEVRDYYERFGRKITPLYVHPPAIQIAAPGEGDMARALDWVTNVVAMEYPNATKLTDAIKEAIAAYDPERMAKCGNTVAAPGDVELATQFHEVYERLAPSFGYETRTETRQFDPTSPNGRLMVAVCGEISAALRSQGQANAVELCGVRDTLIVAANNPVSHGGLGGLRELMLTQAHRITAALAQKA